jgi:deoxyadenosine/deoxycytidine kinase
MTTFATNTPAQPFDIIAIEGNIGTGKSNLLDKLCLQLTRLGQNGKPWAIITEGVDEDKEFDRLLKAFTEDPTKRIEFQRYITQRRANIVKDLDPNFNYVMERSLFSDLVFCQANLAEACRPDGQDLDYYYDIQERLNDYPQVSAVLYLKADPQVSYNRMISRGRDAEQGTPLSYLKLVSGMHDVLLPQICERYNSALLVQDWTNFGDAEQCAMRILTEVNKRLFMSMSKPDASQSAA